MSVKTSYLGIDVLKFIMALSVLIIHFQPLKDFSELAHHLSADGWARLAVPFFFMSTGYFTQRKTLTTWVELKSRLIKYLKLWWVWSLVYVPLRLIGFWINDAPWLDDVRYFVRDVFFQGVYIHLWYIPAVILSLIVIHLWLKRFSFKSILIVSAILYLLGSLGDAYYHLLPVGSFLQQIYQPILAFTITTRSGLFFGLFFVALGHGLKDVKWSIRPDTTMMWFLFSLIVLYGELFILLALGKPFDFNMRLGLVPSSILLFLWALNANFQVEWSGLWLRSMSTVIYFSHFLMFYLFMTLVTILNLGVLAGHSFLRFSFTLMITLVYSRWLLKRAARKPGLARSLVEG